MIPTAAAATIHFAQRSFSNRPRAGVLSLPFAAILDAMTRRPPAELTLNSSENSAGTLCSSSNTETATFNLSAQLPQLAACANNDSAYSPVDAPAAKSIHALSAGHGISSFSLFVGNPSLAI
jgi:hypothetical protein